MKNLRSPAGAAVCLLMMAYTPQTAAQEDEPASVHITIQEAHGGGKVLVFKDEDGNITVEELGEEEDHEMHFKGEGEDVNVYVIKKGDKEVKVVKKVIIQVEEESEKKMEEKKKEQ